jgi:hypothetical protein
MISKLPNPLIVGWSVRLYQAFLVAYPARFQREYGSEMVEVFRDCCLRTIRQSGMHGMLKLWVITLLDLAQSVVAEHMQKEAQLKNEMTPQDIRRAGWALILGAISFVISIFVAIWEGSDGCLFALLLLVFVSLPLLVFGVLGLRNRYGEKVGGFGKSILLVGAILGPVTSIIGFFLISVNPIWFVIYAGPAVLFICLTLFGVAALYTKPMPRWNGLPLIAGLSYPTMIIFYIITSVMTGDWSGSSVPNVADVVYIILITMQGIALLALGYILKANVPEEKIVIA